MKLRKTRQLLLAVFALASAALHAEEVGTPTPFIPALPASALSENAPAAVRELALRALVGTGDIDAARDRLARAATAAERLVLLDALGATGALRERDEPLLLAFCESPNAGDALAGFPLLAKLDSGSRASEACFRKGMARAEPEVRAAAARAAAKSGRGAALVPDFLRLAQSRSATDRRAGVGALVALAARGKSVENLGKTPEEVAEALLEKDPALAGDIVFALLRAGLAIPERFFPRLDALSDNALLGVVESHGAFPNRLNSDFLRRLVSSTVHPRAATAAAALLASRNSVKSNATLACLAGALNDGSPESAAAVTGNLETDSEFALIPRWGESSPMERASNDRFGEIGSLPASFLGNLAPSFRAEWRRVGPHIPPEQHPDIFSILRFLGALEKASRDERLASETRNNAYEALLVESGSPQLARIIHYLLANSNPRGLQIALRIGMRHPDDPRLLEPTLLAFATGAVPPDYSPFAALAPFLERSEAGERSRVLANAGRKLAAASDSERKTLALVLLAAHGAPNDIGNAVKPVFDSPDPLVRRAAYHALSRLAPEIFMLRAKALAADPDPRVRETVPLAFFRTGYRWEHLMGGGIRVSQWVRRDIDFRISDENFETLRSLLGDTVPSIRLNTLLALAQHGRLEDPAPLLELCASGDTALLTARVARSIGAARDAGLAVPPTLEKFLPPPPSPAATTPDAPPLELAVFAEPGNARAPALAETVSMFRAAHPGVRVTVFFANSDATGDTREALRKYFPVPFAQQKLPMLVFSSAAWFAGETAPDFALLCELADHAAGAGSRRVETALETVRLATPPAIRNALDNTEFPREEEKPKADLFEALVPNLSGENMFTFFVVCSVLAALLAIGILHGNKWYQRHVEKAAFEKNKPRKKKKNRRKGGGSA